MTRIEQLLSADWLRDESALQSERFVGHVISRLPERPRRRVEQLRDTIVRALVPTGRAGKFRRRKKGPRTGD